MRIYVPTWPSAKRFTFSLQLTDPPPSTQKKVGPWPPPVCFFHKRASRRAPKTNRDFLTDVLAMFCCGLSAPLLLSRRFPHHECLPAKPLPCWCNVIVVFTVLPTTPFSSNRQWRPILQPFPSCARRYWIEALIRFRMGLNGSINANIVDEKSALRTQRALFLIIFSYVYNEKRKGDIYYESLKKRERLCKLSSSKIEETRGELAPWRRLLPPMCV